MGCRPISISTACCPISTPAAWPGQPARQPVIYMKTLLLVGLGGAIGAVSRHLLGVWLLPLSTEYRFPLGTLAVNVIGCFLIGVLAAFFQRHAPAEQALRPFLITGILGGFTTFSAFGLETFELIRRGEPATALLYVAASLVLGLLAVWGGWRVG